MLGISYSVIFDVFDKNWPVPSDVWHALVGGHDCALRFLVESTFITDSYWKYDKRKGIALFVRSDEQLYICLRDETRSIFPKKRHKVHFDAHMTTQEFEENYTEVVRACCLLSQAIFTFTRLYLGYDARPSWRIVCTISYS